MIYLVQILFRKLNQIWLFYRKNSILKVIYLTQAFNEQRLVPIYSPRSQYNKILNNRESLLNNITNTFNMKTISQIKAEFIKKNDKMTKVQFIKLMLEVYTENHNFIMFK